MADDYSTGACPFAHAGSGPERDFDMFDLPYQTDPAESLRFARDGVPVFYSEAMGYWIVSRYQDVKDIFRDPITFSPCNVLEKLTPAPPEAEEVLRSYDYAMRRTLVNEDEPAHMERRRVLLDAFAPEALEEHRDMVQHLVAGRVDGFIHKGRANLVEEMLWDVPLTVALKFLGVPEEDMDTLREFSVAHTVNTWGRPTPEEQIGVAEGVGRFWQYAGKVLEKMKANPDGQGWMYDMIAKNREMPEVVTDNYLHSMMMAIIVAAHETTALASANALRELLSRPALWRKICADPALIPPAVEECLRHSGSVVAWRRQTTKEAVVGGVAIPAGAKLFLATASANHDPRNFENPDEIDIYRDNAAEHLTFGYGAHQCMGKNIGRMEICAFIEALSRRIPGLRLTEQEFTYLPNTSFRGPEALWVEWDPADLPEAGKVTTLPIGAPDVKSLARTMVVEDVTPAANGILAVTLRPVGDDPLPGWTPGAHIELVLPDGQNRKYSLCGPRDADYYQVAIQREDAGRGGSVWLHDNLCAGQKLSVRGPKNFFRYDSDASFHMLLAGGIGITPILAMADELREAGKPYRLIYTGRDTDRMALLDRVADHGQAAEIHVSSRSGRLDPRSIFASLPRQAQICACGPEGFLDNLAGISEDFPEVHLHVEHFGGNAGALDPEKEIPFEVELVDSGLVLEVPRDKTVLDVLLSAGIDVAHDCCEGLCGSCEVSVLEGEIDHRDLVLTASERNGANRMMSCCSRGKGKLRVKL